jgi:SAM-dependent methyltransferase
LLAPKLLEERYAAWNRRWGAPHGSPRWRRLLRRSLWELPPFSRLVGPFAFQPNSSTRTFEYPWAYHAGATGRGAVALDVGGALSGFAVALARGGARVTVVDPFVDYGASVAPVRDPDAAFRRLNRRFGTSVLLRRTDLPGAGISSGSVDCIYCLSTLEHLGEPAIESTLAEARRVLRPGGRLVATLDLFLNLAPFTRRPANRFGRNLSVAGLVERSGLALVLGRREELLGFPEFDPESVLSDLERYLIAEEYPVLSQALVLAKE